MALIRVDSAVELFDGQPLTFKSPADCSQVTGLVVFYPHGAETLSKEFHFADAHGNNIGDLDLFAADAVVKVVLDLDTNLAFVQNADTNAYLESRFEELEKAIQNATPSDHQQSASTITAGTFAGQVVANASGQAAGTSLLRNSSLVSADTNPTVNGEICWTYK